MDTGARLHPLWSNWSWSFRHLADSVHDLRKEPRRPGFLSEGLGILWPPRNLRLALGRAYDARFRAFRQLVAQRLRPGRTEHEANPRSSRSVNIHSWAGSDVYSHRRDEPGQR